MKSLILLTLLATVLTATTVHATEKRHLKLSDKVALAAALAMAEEDVEAQDGKYSTVTAKIKMPACSEADQRRVKVGIHAGHDLQACNFATMFARMDLETAVSPACHPFIEVEGCQYHEVKHLVSSVATISKDAAKDAKCPASERIKSAQGFGHSKDDPGRACMMARMSARINLENKVKEDCKKYIEVSACKTH